MVSPWLCFVCSEIAVPPDLKSFGHHLCTWIYKHSCTHSQTHSYTFIYTFIHAVTHRRTTGCRLNLLETIGPTGYIRLSSSASPEPRSSRGNYCAALVSWRSVRKGLSKHRPATWWDLLCGQVDPLPRDLGPVAYPIPNIRFAVFFAVKVVIST
jgi:hypothetical protein